MTDWTDWVPTALVGLTFTTLGSLKLYGFARGIVGGRGAPLGRYVCGT